jgi:hypothetical protein
MALRSCSHITTLMRLQVTGLPVKGKTDGWALRIFGGKMRDDGTRPGDDTRFRVSIRIETSIGIGSVGSIQYQYLTDTA